MLNGKLEGINRLQTVNTFKCRVFMNRFCNCISTQKYFHTCVRCYACKSFSSYCFDLLLISFHFICHSPFENATTKWEVRSYQIITFKEKTKILSQCFSSFCVFVLFKGRATKFFYLSKAASICWYGNDLKMENGAYSTSKCV